MADILRVTTPIVEKNQKVQPKKAIDPASQFNVQNTQKTSVLSRQTPITRQSVGMPNESDTPTILMNMLRDPGVTVSYLKNISLLEEIFKLLPANNNTMTTEMEQMFQALLIPPDEIANELQRQADASSIFKGDFFDFLRNLYAQNTQRPEMQNAIADMLKATNNLLNRDDMLGAVANSLEYLAQNLEASKELSPKLIQLAAQFRQADTGDHVGTLKEQTLALLDKVSESILFSPKLAKVVSITIYNLSRYNDSEMFFQEAAMRLRQMLGGSARREVSSFTESFLTALRQAKKAIAQGEASPQQSAQTAPQKGGAAQQRQSADQAQTMEQKGMDPTQVRAARTFLPIGMKQPPSEDAEGQTEKLHTQNPGLEDLPEHITKFRSQNLTQDDIPEQQLTPEQLAARARALTTEQLTKALLDASRQRQQPFAFAEDAMEQPVYASKVMDSLVKMLKRQSGNKELSPSDTSKLESILHSLLSSPCNFTPLLHFVIPSFFQDIRAFAEIWINPDSDDKDMPEGVSHGIHLLMVVDAEAVGRFEAEVFAYEKTVDVNLFCPPEYEDRFGSLVPDMIDELRVKGFAYRIGKVKVKSLAKARSLMDVFKSLPYKRVGVDVRI